MRPLRALLALALLTITYIGLTGCRDPYGSSVTAANVAATSIGQAMQTTYNLEQQGLITAAEASNVLDYMEFANKADEAWLTCATTAHTSGSKAGSFTACATTFNTSLNNPTELALIKVNNASASQTVTTIVNGIVAGVASFETALGGA